MTHVCSRCKRRQPAAEFYKKTEKGWIDADGIGREGVCRTCWYGRVCARRESTPPRERVRRPVSRRADHTVEVGPFREWLESKYLQYGNAAQLAFATGVGERRIRSVLGNEQDRISLSVVDTALTIEGSAFLFELYPDLYPDLDATTLRDVLRVGTPATLSKDRAWLPSAGNEVLA